MRKKLSWEIKDPIELHEFFLTEIPEAESKHTLSIEIYFDTPDNALYRHGAFLRACSEFRDLSPRVRMLEWETGALDVLDVKHWHANAPILEEVDVCLKETLSNVGISNVENRKADQVMRLSRHRVSYTYASIPECPVFHIDQITATAGPRRGKQPRRPMDFSFFIVEYNQISVHSSDRVTRYVYGNDMITEHQRTEFNFDELKSIRYQLGLTVETLS